MFSRRMQAAISGAIVVLALCGTARMAAAQSAPPGPSRWPMHGQTSDGADVTIFQPQMEGFDGNQLWGRAAVAVTPAGQQEPVFGAIWLRSRVNTDRVARTVQVLDVSMTGSRFPNASPVDGTALAIAVQQTIASAPITLSLDQLLAGLETIQKQQSAASDIQTTPPAMIFVQTPAVKVQYDGPPRLVQASDSGMMRVVNTPFFVALDPGSRTYFLKGAGHWFSAPDPMGPFQATYSIPQGIGALADESGYKDPQQPISDTDAARTQIVTATDPTELIWTDGQPELGTIPGTGLLYWANTTSDVFTYINTQQVFVLLSGRWFSAPNQNGPWTFVAPGQLPPDFASIPADSPKGNVLAFVAGTQQAQDAVADTDIPQTAAVDTQNFDQPPVTYDGDAIFQPVDGAPGLSYAVNTDAAVLQYNGGYYCCYNAVWYNCNSPLGTWSVCYSVPGIFYTIPPSCPIYPVRFCYIYGHRDNAVFCGYLPGYVGCYTYNGVVVYGTGYRYQPWFQNRYVPRPATFGYAAQYHAYSGHWGFSVGVALGGGDAWIGQTPRYVGRGGEWFGYAGYRPNVINNNVHINQTIIQQNNVYIQNTQKNDVLVRNVYQRRSDLRKDLVPQPAARPGIAARNSTPQPPRQQNPANPELQKNNVYADKNGDVYRSTDNGWETRQNQKWSPAPGIPAPAAKPGPQAPVHHDEEHHDVGASHDEPVPQHAADAPAEHHDAAPHEDQPAPHEDQPAPQHSESPAEHHETPAPAPTPKENHSGNEGGGGSGADLNKEYHAREAGDSREKNYPSAPSEPAHSAPSHSEPSHSSQAPSAPSGGKGGGSNSGNGSPQGNPPQNGHGSH